MADVTSCEESILLAKTVTKRDETKKNCFRRKTTVFEFLPIFDPFFVLVLILS